VWIQEKCDRFSTWETSTDIKEPILSRHAIDLFMVFSTFEMDKFGKTIDTTGGSALTFVKLPNLKD